MARLVAASVVYCFFAWIIGVVGVLLFRRWTDR